MVGYPGSGKSTLAYKLSDTVIFGDVLKTAPKMIKAAEEALKANPSASIVFPKKISGCSTVWWQVLKTP